MKITLFILTLLFIAPFAVQADDIQYTSLAPITNTNYEYVKPIETINQGTFGTYLNNMFKLGIALCTALAVLMIIIGGIQYVSSDAWSKKTDGRERIIAAMFGLLIAFGSYALLQTINPNILNTKLGLRPIKIDEIQAAEKYIETGVVAKDTVKVENGKFEMKGKITEPAFYTIKLEGAQAPIPFILEEGEEVTIEINKDSIKYPEIVLKQCILETGWLKSEPNVIDLIVYG